MKSLQREVLLVLVLFCGAAAGGSRPEDAKFPPADISWGREVFGIRLGVSVAKRTFLQGEPILVVATVQNVSDQPKHVWMPEAGWRVDVSSPLHGPGVDYTLEGKVAYGLIEVARGGSDHGMRLQPNQAFPVVIWINQLRDMTLVGHYSVGIGLKEVRGPEGQYATAWGGPIDIEVTYADPMHVPGGASQILAAVWEADGGMMGENAARMYGYEVTQEVDALAAFAREHGDAPAGRAARAQLKQLSAHLEEFLKDLPPLPKPGEKAGVPKPQVEAGPEQAHVVTPEAKPAAPRDGPERTK